jgi:hypothetical protein
MECLQQSRKIKKSIRCVFLDVILEEMQQHEGNEPSSNRDQIIQFYGFHLFGSVFRFKYVNVKTSLENFSSWVRVEIQLERNMPILYCQLTPYLTKIKYATKVLTK